MGLPIIAG